jgi:SAM-dependent methyltransferase
MLSGFGRVTAIEPDDESRRYAADRTGLPILAGLLPNELPGFATPFDLIAAFDVVEHVPDDQGSLRALGDLLAPSGCLITTVPAYQWMWSSHDEHHHHKRRYTLGQYRAICEKGGLRIRRATYFNSLLFPLIAAVRLLRIFSGQTGGDDAAEVSQPLNRILHGLFASERTLLRHTDLRFGVSILVIADRAT